MRLLTTLAILALSVSTYALPARTLRDVNCYKHTTRVFSIDSQGVIHIGKTVAHFRATIYDGNWYPNKVMKKNAGMEVFEPMKGQGMGGENYYVGGLYNSAGKKLLSLTGYMYPEIDAKYPVWSAGTTSEYDVDPVSCAPKSIGAPYYPTSEETIQYLKTQTKDPEMAEYAKTLKAADYPDGLMRSGYVYGPWQLYGAFNKDRRESENRMRRAEFSYDAFTRQFDIRPFQEIMIEGP